VEVLVGICKGGDGGDGAGEGKGETVGRVGEVTRGEETNESSESSIMGPEGG